MPVHVQALRDRELYGDHCVAPQRRGLVRENLRGGAPGPASLTLKVYLLAFSRSPGQRFKAPLVVTLHQRTSRSRQAELGVEGVLAPLRDDRAMCFEPFCLHCFGDEEVVA